MTAIYLAVAATIVAVSVAVLLINREIRKQNKIIAQGTKIIDDMRATERRRRIDNELTDITVQATRAENERQARS